MRIPVLILLHLSLFVHSAAAQSSGNAGSALQASNLLNPNVSAIGWLQGAAGRGDEAAASLKEVELGLQAVVDPFARADIFIGFDPDEIAVEEGYLSFYALPVGLKLGKFHSDFDPFNRVHTPETAFADRPLVAENYLGPESLTSTGLSADWQVPNPLLFLSLTGEITRPENGGPAFDRAEKRDLLYVGRLKAYQDLTEAVNLTLGISVAHGPAGIAFDAPSGSSTTLRGLLSGADLTLRWKNPRHAVYRSLFWRTEALLSRRDAAANAPLSTWGMFSHLEWQFARRWRVGGRYDWSQSPASKAHDSGALGYLTFMPSEFSLFSLQGRVRKAGGRREDAGFLKATFSIGPHGAHPF